jgi:hypothetical protein
MIKYSLQCSNGHGFDGWFKDSTTFDQQSTSGLLTCPQCDDPHVAKTLMAPHIGNNAGKNRGAETSLPAPVAPQPMSTPVAPAPALTPVAFTPQQAEAMEQVGEMIKKVKEHILDTCKDVGGNLAEEARKMHYGEKKAAGIYGTATKDDVEDLLDEGIEVMPAPFLQKTDA